MFRWSAALRALSVADAKKALGALGLGALATQDDVRKAYLDLARQHHPDLSGGDDTVMKKVNAAYELLSSSAGVAAVKEAAAAQDDGGGAAASDSSGGMAGTWTQRETKRQRSQLDRNLAAADVWMCRTDMDWETAMNDVSPQELRDPSNHPFSPSKYFSFEDDKAIYRMMRSGASVRQVAKSLGMEAGMVDRRLSNAQFKQRIAHLLKAQKTQRWVQGDKAPPSKTTERGRQTAQAVRQPRRETAYAQPSDHAVHFEGPKHRQRDPSVTPASASSASFGRGGGRRQETEGSSSQSYQGYDRLYQQ